MNGKLEEEVYRDPPQGYEEKYKSKICKLRRFRYSIKESPRAWLKRLTRFVKKQKYVQGQVYHTKFTQHSLEGKATVFIVYANYIILTGDNVIENNNLKECLASKF